MEKLIRISEDESSVYRIAAQQFVQRAEESVHAAGRFTVALSGGSTPRGLYSLLADDDAFRTRMPWANSHFFWGDERHVPPDHADSNYRMAHQAMLSRVAVPPRNIHRIPGERSDANQAADEYEEELRRFFRLSDG